MSDLNTMSVSEMEQALAKVEGWPFGDDGEYANYLGLMAYIKSVWWAPDWGWHEEDVVSDGALIRRYHISTGGMSGNEVMLSSMQKNWAFWAAAWKQHRVGGHYIFELPNPVGAYDG